MGPADVDHSPQHEECRQHRQVAVGQLALGALAFDEGVSIRMRVRGDAVMGNRLKTMAAASLTLLLAVCLTAEAETTATVRGEATYRERLAVPPGARLEVLLLDVSRADAPAQTIGSVTLTDIAQPPDNTPGADRDEHGCIRSAGYSWCAKEGKCLRPWELAKEKGLASTEEAFRAYCSGTR
jgi:hypothetical protein